ncbi:MAG TPA: hypothetical protein VFL47_05910 [Flavisolibacter sp.]|nr:hypothetical protein [Flavisolibacter sp.]
MEQLTTPKRKRSGTVKRILIYSILGLVLVGALVIFWRYYYTYSDGNRFGLLQKFSHKGNLFKTYEGEMILSSINSNQNVPIASEKFYFSVTDEEVAKKLDNLQGHHVTVHYKQKNNPAFWRGESEYIVDSVKAETQ